MLFSVTVNHRRKFDLNDKINVVFKITCLSYSVEYDKSDTINQAVKYYYKSTMKNNKCEITIKVLRLKINKAKNQIKFISKLFKMRLNCCQKDMQLSCKFLKICTTN